ASGALSIRDEAHEEENWLMHGLARIYLPLFDFALRRKKLAILVAAIPVVLALLGFGLLGREFMPHLEEGNFWIRAPLPTSISLEQAAKYVGRMRSIVLGCTGDGPEACSAGRRQRPEVETVVSQLGRPDDGTDVSGFYNIELFAPLKPSDEWRRGVTKEK